jgi:hypothetical protein
MDPDPRPNSGFASDNLKLNFYIPSLCLILIKTRIFGDEGQCEKI